MFLQLLSLALVAMLPILLLFVMARLINTGMAHPEYFKENAAHQKTPEDDLVLKVLTEKTAKEHSFSRYKRFS